MLQSQSGNSERKKIVCVSLGISVVKRQELFQKENQFVRLKMVTIINITMLRMFCVTKSSIS